MAFSPDGRVLATAGRGRVIVVHECASREMRLSLAGQEGVSALSLSPGGTLLASGSKDSTMVVWDVTGKALARPAASDDALWEDLGSDARTAFGAMGRLLLDPRRAVALFKARLRNTGPMSDEKAEELLVLLGDEDGELSGRAERALGSAGPSVRRLVREAQTKTLAVGFKERLGRVLAKLDRQKGAEFRPGRAVEVLERLGTPEARALLAEMVKRDGGVARDAEASLERLEGRR
jgi:hypothetical protein